MRPIRVTVSGVAASPPIAISNYNAPCNVGLGVKISATATYTVQFTFDDIFASNFVAGSAVWYNSSDTGVVAATANAMSNLAFPVTAVRVNVTASTGTVTMTVIQAGEK